jgi:hypothetical protein
MRACRTLETVPGGRSFGRAGLAMPFVGTGVGCMVVSPERSAKGLWVRSVIYGGISPSQLGSTWEAPRNAYDRAMATY